MEASIYDLMSANVTVARVKTLKDAFETEVKKLNIDPVECQKPYITRPPYRGVHVPHKVNHPMDQWNCWKASAIHGAAVDLKLVPALACENDLVPSGRAAPPLRLRLTSIWLRKVREMQQGFYRGPLTLIAARSW